jgi:hypothetical protein
MCLPKPLTLPDLLSRLKMKENRFNQIMCGDVNLTLKEVAQIYHALGERPKIVVSRL